MSHRQSRRQRCGCLAPRPGIALHMGLCDMHDGHDRLHMGLWDMYDVHDSIDMADTGSKLVLSTQSLVGQR